jgi:hypothetical protein
MAGFGVSTEALAVEDLVARCFKASAIAFSAKGFKIA